MIDAEKVKEIAHAEAMRLVAHGVAPEQAVEWATDLALRKARRGNLGQVKVIEEAASLAKKGSELVSPFLWILSIVGFAMAVLNAERIAKMYGSWRAGKKAIKEGRLPEA